MNAPLLMADRVTMTFSAPPTLFARLSAAMTGGQIKHAVFALSNVSLALHRGEMVGLVGESGCGKSTLARVVSGILRPTSGSVLLDGKPIMVQDRKITTRIQTIFQDPFASLDGRMRVGDTIAEGPVAHGLIASKDRQTYVNTWLETVGLGPAQANRYPHQFSGGQRQRVAIARALAMRPDVLVCDEPVASLDVSIQAQIINLFLRLRRELNVTILFISHDLSVVRHLCDRVAVMYLGRIVESGSTAQVYERPAHPYTAALIEAVPKIGQNTSFKPIPGEIPSPLDPPDGCAFHTRCQDAITRCRNESPDLKEERPGRWVACHRAAAILQRSQVI